MVVYVEYAFLENFLFDGALICLSLTASKVPLKRWRIASAAACGGIFALLYPLLRLSSWKALVLKLSIGALLCMLAFGRIKNKKDWGRYALTTVLFFAFTFAFGGALTSVYTTFPLSRLPDFVTVIGFSLLSGLTCLLIAKMYRKRADFAYVYLCKVYINGKTGCGNGYFDSGNTATKNGLPICFLSPDFFYEILGHEIVFCGGQVCDEIQITTLAGTRKIPAYKGEIAVKKGGRDEVRKEVYFAMGANMIQREYKILLNAGVFEG